MKSMDFSGFCGFILGNPQISHGFTMKFTKKLAQMKFRLVIKQDLSKERPISVEISIRGMYSASLH